MQIDEISAPRRNVVKWTEAPFGTTQTGPQFSPKQFVHQSTLLNRLSRKVSVALV